MKKFDTPPVRLACRHCGKPIQGRNRYSAWQRLALHVADNHDDSVDVETAVSDLDPKARD